MSDEKSNPLASENSPLSDTNAVRKVDSILFTSSIILTITIISFIVWMTYATYDVGFEFKKGYFKTLVEALAPFIAYITIIMSFYLTYYRIRKHRRNQLKVYDESFRDKYETPYYNVTFVAFLFLAGVSAFITAEILFDISYNSEIISGLDSRFDKLIKLSACASITYLTVIWFWFLKLSSKSLLTLRHFATSLSVLTGVIVAQIAQATIRSSSAPISEINVYAITFPEVILAMIIGVVPVLSIQVINLARNSKFTVSSEANTAFTFPIEGYTPELSERFFEFKLNSEADVLSIENYEIVHWIIHGDMIRDKREKREVTSAFIDRLILKVWVEKDYHKLTLNGFSGALAYLASEENEETPPKIVQEFIKSLEEFNANTELG